MALAIRTLGFGYRLGVAIRTLRMRRQLRKLPRQRVADFDENKLGKIIGNAVAHGPVLQAPLTDRLCVYYALEIKRYEYKVEETVHDEQRTVPFALDDGTGQATIDAETAQFSTSFDHAIKITAGQETPFQRELLASFGLPITGRVQLVYYLREAVIALDQQICLVGAGIRELDTKASALVDGAYRDGTQTTLHLAGSDRFPLVITDDPRVLK
ncbi:MAG: GIDE domain-containing protein [Kofleriaceae bacterium]